MDERRSNRAALVFGVFFVVVGVVFLLERLEVWDFEFRYVAPTLLIALGVAVLLGGRERR